MTKRVLSFLLCLSLVLCVAGCRAAKSSDDEDSGSEALNSSYEAASDSSSEGKAKNSEVDGNEVDQEFESVLGSYIKTGEEGSISLISLYSDGRAIFILEGLAKDYEWDIDGDDFHLYESGAEDGSENEISGKYEQGKIDLGEYGTFVLDRNFVLTLPEQ